jgi:hypothetical protein
VFFAIIYRPQARTTDISENARVRLFAIQSVGGREMLFAFARNRSTAASPSSSSSSSSCDEIYAHSLNPSPSRDDGTLSVYVKGERLARQAAALASEFCEDWLRAYHRLGHG